MDERLDLDRRIAAIAARQRGLIEHRQLLALGCSSSAIARRVEAGRLHRVHRRVYLVGHAVPVPGAHWLAAVLACGDGTVLSWRSATAAWDLGPDRPFGVDVTIPRSRGRRLAGIVAHRARLDPIDRMTVDGIPVTTVARTLLDLAAIESERGLDATLERAAHLGRLDLAAIEDVLARAGGHRGRGRLGRAVERLDGDSGRSRSELERRTRRLIVDAGLPQPRLNATVLGFEVDLLWARERLVVELDGWEHHRGRRAFEVDRRRDAELQAAGYRVQRFTWRQIADQPLWVVRCLAGLLERPPVA